MHFDGAVLNTLFFALIFMLYFLGIRGKTSVVYHPNTVHLISIGMVPALVGWYIRLVFFVL